MDLDLDLDILCLVVIGALYLVEALLLEEDDMDLDGLLAWCCGIVRYLF